MVQSYTHLFSPDSISLYIHWPFCLSKCPYCSFNSYPILELIDFENWKNAYIFAIQEIAKKTKNRRIRSIYFGGGTPSLLPPKFLEDLLAEIAWHWSVEPNVEVSIEINPGTVNETKIRDFKTAGVNRASVGVQSLNEDGIAILGRRHSIATAMNTVQVCSKLFQSVSLDMIYARPGHSLSIWKEELELALSLDIPHLSLYQLVVEEESVFGDMYHRGELLLPDEDVCADLFDLTQELTTKAGRPAYEISNHAIANHECIHNIGYWMYYDYIGIGPGAHSRITFNNKKYALVQEAIPRKWLNSIIENNEILEEKSELFLEEQGREAILVGLRMTKGISCARLPLPLDQMVDPDALNHLVQEGYLEYNQDVLVATSEGRKRLNALLAYLLK